MKRAAGALGALVVVLLAAWAGHRAHLAELHARSAIAVPAGEASAPAPLPTGIPADGTPEPGLAASRTIPDRLPPFTLQDRRGHATPISTWEGTSLIINFWATWCAPCRREIPLLRALRRERVADHLEVVGVAVDSRPAVLDFAARLGIDYPLLIGEDGGMEAADSLGMDTVFPFTLFADRRHRIVAAKVGELHADEAAFILDRVHDIDAGHLDLPAARTAIADKLRELAVARAQHPEN